MASPDVSGCCEDRHLVVDLYRTLLEKNVEVYEPYLATALGHLAKYYLDSGDLESALPPSNERIKRQRATLDRQPSFQSKFYLAASLAEHWSIVTAKDGWSKGWCLLKIRLTS